MSIFSRILRRQGTRIPNGRGRKATPRLEKLETRALLATFTVRNTSSEPLEVDSLPYAIFQANNVSPGLDFINFNINGGGEHTITLTAQMFIGEQVVINGASQPGYIGRPLIHLRGGMIGGSALPSLFVLQQHSGRAGVKSDVSTIQGLGMSSFSNEAVEIQSTSIGNWIQYNSIGFSPNRANPILTSQASGSADGVDVKSSYNVVRGNTISGVRNGVVIGDGAFGSITNAVIGNNIGTDPTGDTTAGYGNLSTGILLLTGAKQNFLGEDNVISGNEYGIHLSHSTNIENVAFRNKIGTNRAGNTALGNRNIGILLAAGTAGNAIGGNYEGNGGNLISGNLNGGIALSGGSDNFIQKNVLGLNSSKTGTIGSQRNGIVIGGGTFRTAIQDNILGGHMEHGILMENTQGNYLSDNFVGRNESGTFFANNGFGIALSSGATSNTSVSTRFGENRRGNVFNPDTAAGNVIG